MKSKCKDISSLLADYAAGELFAVDQADRQRVEQHLSTCPQCREDAALMQRLNRDTRHLDQECLTVMAAVDWEETAQTISDHIPFKTAVVPGIRQPGKFRQPRFNLNWGNWGNWGAAAFNWRFALASMAGIFVLGIWLGYLLFHTPVAAPSASLTPQMAQTLTEQPSPLARLENTLARKEVASYFNQTELVFMDLMKQCSTDGTFSLQDQVDMRRVQELLSRSRYFKDNLENPRLLSSKELMKKIEWLLYEILMTNTDEDSSCQKLQKLQNYIKDERLLIKMRLVGKELSVSEV